MDETRVRYKAIVDFTSLSRAIRTAKKNLKELREEEEKLNAQSIRGAGQATQANERRARSMEALANASQAQSRSIREATAEFISNARAARDATQATQNLATSHRTATTSTRQHTTATTQATAATQTLAGVTRNAYRTIMQHNQATNQAAGAQNNFGRGARNNQKQLTGLLGAVDKLNSGFKRLGNWRPHLIPPFIALIPIIAGLIGLINPLVAGLGAVAGAAIGFASSLGSIAPAALAVVPALGLLLSMIGSLKAAFGGIGGAFKAFSAMKKAANPATAKAELTQQEEITRAQEKYARAIQDVAWAQEDLDEERKDYIKRLQELQRAVDKAAQSELRAAANAQLARENYANVLADPGSTKGEKMSAKAGVGEAQDEYADVIQQNKDNAAELADMKRKGAEGDREVIRAQRALTDAIWAQRDAQLALANAQSGQGNQLATATNEYAAALDKLSPSARRFVEILVGMNEEWTAIKKNVQEAFFSQFVDDVDRLRLIFGPLESLMTNTASALGRFVDNFLLLITSPKWQSDIVLFGENNVPIIDDLGDGIVDLVDAFKDIAIVAQEVLLMPFAERFRAWAEEFRNWVNLGRESGGLQEYLEGVRTRLDQWWRIVKNVGMTLYNFGKAASPFGDWITTGLEETTQGWLASSEEALGPNSKFRQWLEDIKPLVSEIKGLFADFFGWFARESADVGNIDQMTDMIKVIRDDLGPAIGGLLDALSDAEVGPKFLEAVTTIVEIITTLAENPATDTFFTILNVLLDFLKWCVQNPVIGSILATIATGFASIAAVSVVAKFSGLSALINWLLKLARGGGGLPGLLKGIAGGFLGMMGIKTGLGAATAATGAAAGKAAGPAAAAVAGTRRGPGGGSFKPAAVSKGLGVFATLGKLAPKSVVTAASKGLGALGTIGKSLVRGAGGGPVGIIASIAGGLAGAAISDSAAKGGAGAGQRIAGNVVGGVAAGAGTGAFLGSLVMPGIGTAIGAGVGAVAGGAMAFAGSSEEDKAAFFEDLGRNWNSFWGEKWPEFWTGLATEFGHFLEDIGTNWNTFWGESWPTFWAGLGEAFTNWINVEFPHFIGEMAANFYLAFTEEIPRFFEEWGINWDTYWGETFPKFWDDWMADIGTFFTEWGENWNGYWGTEFPKFWTNWANGVPGFFTEWGENWNGYWGTEFPRFWTDWGAGIAGFFTDFGKSWDEYWGDEWPAFWDGLANGWNDFWGGIGGWLGDIGKEIGKAFAGRVAEHEKEKSGDVPPGAPGAGGQTLSRVMSMLPQGMRISSTYRSPSENAAAGGASNSYHMDRANPAVDIVGSADQMAAFATKLGQIGGWRQLYYNGVQAKGVGFWPGHWDHIHVANTGGPVPGAGNGNKDSVPSLLTPGEFVVRNAISRREGPNKMKALNSGRAGISYFNAGGLVPNASPIGGGRPADAKAGGMGGGGTVIHNVEGGVTFGDIHIHNPEPEPASESLPRTVRKLVYVGKRG